MKDLIKETINKIKKQGIAPEPRWKYLVKKYGIWGLFLVIVLLGAISFSVALDMSTQLDWDLYRFAHQSILIYFLTLLPYFWMAIIGIFLALAFFDLRKTETGYKYGLLKMLFASMGGITAIGLIFSLVGFGGKSNALLSKDVPYYGKHMMTKEKQWSKPDKGFLSGKITAISSDKLEINDLNGQKWNVLLDEKTLTRPAANIAQKEMIKVIGIKKDKNNFQAIEIRPWMGQGMMNGSGIGGNNGIMNNGGRGMMRDN